MFHLNVTAMMSYMPSLDELALYTFRQLSPATRQKVSIKETTRILSEKMHYYQALTYSQKCQTDFEKVVLVVQNRLKRKRKKVLRQVVRRVLKAEEKYYMQLMMGE
jgi:hypothetical protein